MSQLVAEADLPQNLRSLVQKADAAITAHNHAYAVPLLLPVVKAEPNCLDARRKLRKAAAQAKKAGGGGGGKSFFGGGGLSNMKVVSKAKKEPEAALPELEDALAEDPYNPQLNAALHEAAMALEMPELAAFALETIREGHPSDTKNMHRLAEHYMKQEEPEKAADIYAAILKVDHTDGAARKGMTNANARASIVRQGWGQKENVRDLLRSKEQARSLEDEGRRGMTREQLEARLAEWGQKYEQDPQNLGVAKRIAELYDQLERPEEALQWFEYAHQLSQGDVSLETKVQHLRERLEEKHLQELRAQIEANPDDPEIESKRAELEQLKQARALKGIDSARERVERNPTDPQLRFELGTALHEAGQFSEAIPELQRAKANPHIRHRCMLLLAKCYRKKGILDLALRQLSEGAGELTAMDSLKKEILYLMGEIYQEQGKKEEALDSFKQIYEADYNYRDVAQRVESAYA